MAASKCSSLPDISQKFCKYWRAVVRFLHNKTHDLKPKIENVPQVQQLFKQLHKRFPFEKIVSQKPKLIDFFKNFLQVIIFIMNLII